MTAERSINPTRRDAHHSPALDTLQSEELLAPELMPGLPFGLAGAPPDHPTTRSGRHTAVQRIQRTHGNRFVQRLLQREDGAAQQDEPQPIDVSGIQAQEELPGAGFTIQRWGDGATNLVQRQSTGNQVVANISLTSNPPTVQIRPGAEIGAAHGRPGAVGWTTPSYNIQVPFGNTYRVDITVALDFVVELPSDYDQPRQQVVSDHEIGHIRIGERKAKEHLVDGLKTSIESNTGGLSPSIVQSAITAAAQSFRTAEGEGSQNYDNADYSRMVEAYRGTRASLSELSAQSAAIATMASTIRRTQTRIYSALRSYDEAGVEAAAADVALARSSLSAQELARLQYNQEFQGRVGSLRSSVNSYLSGSGLLGMPYETLPDSMRNSLQGILGTLGAFTFSPSGASAGF